MPDPLSPKSGFGMQVTVLPYFVATFLMTYLYNMTLSAMVTRLSNFMSISDCPAVPTSWCWASNSMPQSISVCIISLRMFIIWSAGGTGK